MARRAFGFFVLAALVSGGIALVAYRLAHTSAMGELRERAAGRLAYHGRELTAALEKFEHLPHLLGIERTLVDLIYDPGAKPRVDAANRYLEFAQNRANVAAAYLIDTNGTALASSNWRHAKSFVGHNYAFRPYVQEAMAGRTGRFYGVGATTGEAGFFIAAPITSGADVIGLAAVKVSLFEVETEWRRSRERLAVADQNGVIFLATDPQWRYRSLAPLPDTVRDQLRQTRQYGEAPLLPLQAGQNLAPDAAGVAFGLDHQGAGRDYFVQSLPSTRRGWQVLIFSDPAEAAEFARLAALIAGLSAALFLTGLGLAFQYRRRLAERFAARRELDRVSAVLEHRIAERTQALTESNENLRRNIAELRETESILRATRDNAVQAGKLAALGQMAAGVTHELNQPLSALRMLSDNAQLLLARGEAAAAAENLRHIAATAANMGEIVAELKAFARKDPVLLRPVPLGPLLASTLMLVEPRRRESANLIVSRLPEPLPTAFADPVRLEQVLVNLLRNALDANEKAARHEVEIRVEVLPEHLRISIRDQGGGLTEQVRTHLFEPFFTTKPGGQGLGLGLALSHAIMRDLGGDLSAANGVDGAEFSLTLPRAPDPSPCSSL